MGGIPASSVQIGAPDPTLRISRVNASLPGLLMRSSMDVFRCRCCDEVIGVYEPLVAHTPSGARTTSRAAEPDLKELAGVYYHRGCYPFSDR